MLKHIKFFSIQRLQIYMKFDLIYVYTMLFCSTELFRKPEYNFNNYIKVTK